MYLHAKKDNWMAALYEVVDLDTGKIIPHVLWANDEDGVYEQVQYDADDNIILIEGEIQTILQKGNIYLRPKNYISY